MKALLIAALFTLTTSCGKTADQKEADQLKAEGLSRISTANSAMKDLNEKYGINLSPLTETNTATTRAKAYDWAKPTAAQRKEIRTKLFNYVNNVTRVQEIGNHKNMQLLGGGDSLKSSSDAAWAFYLAAEAYEKSLKSR